ncbi:L-lactate dehydrogenase (cytochrome) [Amycolatopsis bartoniae]|uniref:Alpha-hydroxy-acid oxidizing enzyme n=1 Tax=Amycolatopsis bartoniae TaxID=941986 RepID=A0A8H9MD69_9PSEU|nr:alpha-hydroxy acid oxidase [Amycolatopsis bartoniae]MBB2936749.1 L-lactate dehydrogenase (cytochrome) [Amycolatopsis bartoniae]TVT09200.1 alpha-hydroxy-acid oxidizing protein [Amycolatopsis bartoniae]GHF49868.1 alpha-hydroxy-acid oxidizing enzyme [Amycolatopsis bartoniae]
MSDAAPDVPAFARRRLPRPAELRELLRFRALELDPVRRRLDRALTIEDLRRIGRRTTPRAVFDYVDGAADGEVTAARNLDAFKEAVFVPESLNPVRDTDLSTVLFGQSIALPLVFAPTGYTRMMHHHGEIAVARVAARHGIPYALSTVGTTNAGQLRQAVPDGDNWFQLYLTNSRELNEELVDRAGQAGFSTLLLTIDTAVAGRRLKDVRHGLTIPPTLTPRTVLDMARFPLWCLNKLTTPPIGFASLESFPGSSADVAAMMFDPGLSYDDLRWLRAVWPGRLLVKGILRPSDAKRVVELGADGVVVSNHGGRQLDRTPSTLDALPAVRKAVGPDVTVLLDGGVRHGQDILAAVALGADVAMIGRAYLYGLMAGGERGVERALEILRDEYRRGLQLLGLDATRKISSRHVRKAVPSLED